MIELLSAIFLSYISCVVVAQSYVASGLRGVFRRMAGRLAFTKKHFVDEYDYISCRLCIGFPVSVLSSLLLGVQLPWIPIVYGASYWLATQER